MSHQKAQKNTSMHRVNICLFLLAIGIGALALSGCGGSKASSKGSNGAVEDQLGFDQAGIMARQSKIEAKIRDCMKESGFEYVPIDPTAQKAALTGASRISDEDFLKQFGYGISTLWGRGGSQADPNERIYLSLRGAEKRAYEKTLWGENVGASFTAAIESGNFTKLGGCTRKATEAVFGGSQVLTQLQRKLDQLDERILEDQRMVKANERWSKCMATRGFQYEEPDEIDAILLARMEKLVGPVSGQFATGPPPGQTAQSYGAGALRALQREEVATARADYDCEVKEINPVESKVRPQYEAEFREQNQALINQVKPLSSG